MLHATTLLAAILLGQAGDPMPVLDVVDPRPVPDAVDPRPVPDAGGPVKLAIDLVVAAVCFSFAVTVTRRRRTAPAPSARSPISADRRRLAALIEKPAGRR